MANKKYNEFDAGTYDLSKIFLQADAATGELSKIPLPNFSKVKTLQFIMTTDTDGSTSFSVLRNTSGYTISSITNTGTGEYQIVISGLSGGSAYFPITSIAPFDNTTGHIRYWDANSATVTFKTYSWATGLQADLFLSWNVTMFFISNPS